MSDQWQRDRALQKRVGGCAWGSAVVPQGPDKTNPTATLVRGPYNILRWQGELQDWRQYQVTLAPIGRADGRPTLAPEGWNNAAGAPPLSTYAAPNTWVASPVVGPSPTRVMWGTGGIRHEAWFHYPVRGGSFNLVCSSVEVDVFLPDYSPSEIGPPWAADGSDLPVYAGAIGPGQSVNPTAMHWHHRISLATATSGFLRIPPYARRVVVEPDNTGVANFTLAFLGPTGTTPSVMRRMLLAGFNELRAALLNGTFEIPAGCLTLQITNNNASSESVAVTWEIGF